MGDLADRVKEGREWLREKFSPPVLTGLGAGAASYLGMQELGDHLRENGLSIYQPLGHTALSVIYGGMAFISAMNLHYRIQFRAQFRRFLGKIRWDARGWMQDAGQAMALGLLVPLVKANHYIADLVHQGRLGEEMPKLAINMALPAVPSAIAVYSLLQAFRKQNPKRVLELCVGHMTSTFLSTKKGLDLYTEANQHYPSQFLHFAIAKKHAELGNIEDAVLSVYEGYEHSKEEPLLRSRQARRAFVSELAYEHRKVQRRRRRRPEDLDLRLQGAILHAMAEDRRRVIDELEHLARGHRQNDDLQLLYAMTLQREGLGELAKERFAMVGESLIRKGGFARIGESANTVLEYTPSRFIRNVIVIKRGRREDIENEARMTGALEDTLKGHQEYRVPTILGVVGKDEARYLIMKRGHGKLLEEAEETDAYQQAADLLAYLQVMVPPHASRKGKMDVVRATGDRLRNLHLRLEDGIVRGIMDNYGPVAKAATALRYAINFDAHAQQFMLLASGGMLKMDNEDKGLVPIGFDAANLCMGRVATDMDRIVATQHSSIIRYGGTSMVPDYRAFRLACLNSFIPRAFGFVAAKSSPDRPGEHGERAGIIGQAEIAIDRIRDEHRDYYHEHARMYDNLRGFLGEMRLTFGPA